MMVEKKLFLWSVANLVMPRELEKKGEQKRVDRTEFLPLIFCRLHPVIMNREIRSLNQSFNCTHIRNTLTNFLTLSELHGKVSASSVRTSKDDESYPIQIYSGDRFIDTDLSLVGGIFL